MNETNQSTMASQNYYYGSIITPYQSRAQQWDKPVGAIVTQTARWRWVFMINMLLSLLLSVYLLMLANQPQQRVWGVAITSNGFVVNTGLLADTVKAPTHKGESHGTK